MEITKDKITDIFCIIDDFCEEYDKDIEKMSLKAPDGRRHRKRSCVMSRSEIMTILVCFHFNQFRNFKHYYLLFSTLIAVNGRKSLKINKVTLCIWIFGWRKLSLHHVRTQETPQIRCL